MVGSAGCAERFVLDGGGTPVVVDADFEVTVGVLVRLGVLGVELLAFIRQLKPRCVAVGAGID